MKCYECAGVVSDKATCCPHCGAPVCREHMVPQERENETNDCSRSLHEDKNLERTTESKDVLTDKMQERNGNAKRYFCECFLILGLILLGVVLLGVCNFIASVVMEKSPDQSLTTSLALASLYFVWPLERIVYKYNSFRAGRIVGNVLIGVLVLGVVLATCGIVFDRSLVNNSTFSFSMMDCVPLGTLAFAIWYISGRRSGRL